ncbi:MAG: efflux RND transporter permease subunit [Pseudomonadota bacterium]
MNDEQNRDLGSNGGPNDGAQPAAGGVIPFFVRHPNAANLLMIMMIAFGIYGILQINTQFFPTVETNRIGVSVEWRGASAEDVSRNILDVVEPEVRFLDNVKQVESYAREGAATVGLEFDEGADMQKALSDVEQAIAGISSLPEGAETPVVTRTLFYETVARVALRGPFSEQALKRFARQVRDRLLDEGIDRVEFDGLRDGEIEAVLSTADLRRLGLTVGDVANRIAQNSQDLPSGDLDGDVERQIRMLGEAETPSAIGRIEVTTLATGERVLLRDIAVVRDTVAEDGPRGLSGGMPAIELNVQRAANADTLEMAEIMERALAKVRAELPATIELLTYQAGAERVAERIGLLVKNGAGGLILVVCILLLFLKARIALWVAAGVPVALLATIGFMWASGQTINMLSLFGLIMTLGIIVDDAIVVGEHTDTRLSMGDPPQEAAIAGAGRMITPVVAAMLTTVAAFAPILLIGDVIGQIVGALPLVAVAVLAASLIECFFILPNHLSHASPPPGRRRISFIRMALLAVTMVAPVVAVALSQGFAIGLGLPWLFDLFNPAATALGPFFIPVVAGVGVTLAYLIELRLLRAGEPGPKSFRARFDAGFDWFKTAVVRRLAMTAVSLRYATTAFCVALFMVAVGLIQGGRLPFVFFPSPEAENVNASITLYSGTPEVEAIRAVEAVEAALVRAEQRLSPDEPLTRASFVTLGKAGNNRGDNFARISVELTSSEVRSVRTTEIVRAWREELPDFNSVKRVSIAEARLGPPGRDFDIRLIGEDPTALKAAARDVQQTLGTFPGVSGLDDDLPYGKPEFALELTPRGAVLGFTAESVAAQVRDAVEGRVARRIATIDEEIKIRVRQNLEGTGGDLRAMELKSPSGDFVPLSEVVTVTERQGFSVIVRRDGRPTVSVTADVNPAVTTNVEIQETLERVGAIDRIAARYGVTFEFSGRAEERRDAFADLRIGGIVALLAMYLIIAALFAHYARPLAVLMIVPFGAVGMIIGHWLMNIPLTMMSFIGLLGLSGILVNDSIILVSRFAERLRAGEIPLIAAVGASVDRTRAVILTSLSTILGLTPLLFERSLQAQFLLPMATTIVFGIGVATIFVLFLTPSLLMIGHDIQRVARRLRGEPADGPGGGAGAATPAE